MYATPFTPWICIINSLSCHLPLPTCIRETCEIVKKGTTHTIGVEFGSKIVAGTNLHLRISTLVTSH
jgi:hypothetical protein